MKTEGMSETEINARHAEKMRRKKEARDKIIATKTIEKGLLIVHTGKGKGKSTAAFGLVFRALGNGMKVAVVQFVKGKWQTGERAALEKFGDQVTISTMGEGFTWETQDRARDIAAARSAWEKARALIMDPEHQLVVLDELNIVLRYDYLDTSEVIAGPERAPSDETCGRHRTEREGRADRGGGSRHRDGAGEAPLPIRREGSEGNRVLNSPA
jgi:cob(I)alamin adenosyltransferase